jgi:hypothetical protein
MSHLEPKRTGKYQAINRPEQAITGKITGFGLGFTLLVVRVISWVKGLVRWADKIIQNVVLKRSDIL